MEKQKKQLAVAFMVVLVAVVVVSVCGLGEKGGRNYRE